MEPEPQVSFAVDHYEVLSDSECESSSDSTSRQFRDFARNGMKRLDCNHGEYGVLERNFATRMGIGGMDVNVVAIHKASYSTAMGQARLESFRIFSRAVATTRGGDANLRFGWYGGDRDELLGIVNHGFVRCGNSDDGVSHGIGVHLSPLNVPFDCAARAKEDGNGVRHILLCRVILGNTETIVAGSRKFHPSSSNFDSGIDNPVLPRKYIFWSAYMNSHILPQYIISFTSLALAGRNLPNPLGVNFQTLLNVLSRFLHPSQMGFILRCYNDFREHKIDKTQMIENLRSWAGDPLLIEVIKMCRNGVNS